MKPFAIFTLLCLLSFSGFSQVDKTKHKYPVINGNAPRVLKWDTLTINMGRIPQGVPASVKFWFTNKGDKPVILDDVHPSCSCTAPEWSKKPVMPGERGFVIASYSAGATGSFTKSLSVTTDAGEIDILVIKGEVMPAPGNDNTGQGH